MVGILARAVRQMVFVLSAVLIAGTAQSTPFTTEVPGEGFSLPDQYPEAGGVAIVMIGDNGNVYYQFSDPDGAFVGYQNRGRPREFRGNPFTINDPIPLDCGIRSCTDYFGGGIDRMYIRFSAFDGDTAPGEFDDDDISLLMNGFTVGNWSDVLTDRTNDSGTTSFGLEQGFGDGSFNTGWFSTTNQTLLDNILTTGSTTTQVRDRDPNDNYWDFTRGESLPEEALRTIAPGYELEKTADRATFSAVGEVITYTYEITNIGSVNINNLSVQDDKIANVSCDTTTINETTGGGAPEVATCTGTYVVTQQDYDAQQVTNIARATGDPEFGSLGALTDTVTVNGPPVLSPAVEIAKAADRAAFAAVGEVVTYTYTVTNTGDTTLTDIVVTDDKIPGTICTIASLVPQAPNNTDSCTATYTVTQADLDAFAISGTPLTNEATVAAQDPDGGTVGDSVTEDVSGPAAAPSLDITKVALQPNFSAVGDLLQFEIDVTNTGNVTWPAAPAIADPLVTGAGGAVTCPSGAVAPGATITCTGSYSVVQPDLDAGEVENIATADITVGGVSANGTADVTVPANVTTGMTIAKRLPAGSPTTFDAVGDEISYEYVLTNTGTVTLLSPTVSDDKVTASCADASIAPGASIICTSDTPYEVTQADLDAGFVTNVASGSAGTDSQGPVDSPATSLTVNADQNPAMTMDKTAPAIDPGDFVPGLVVTYTYTVLNTGNVTLTDQLQVTDDKIGAPFDCGAGPLAPGASRVCTADYTVTTDDVVAGFVTNRATATDGTTTSTEDAVTIPQSGTPALGLAKVPSPGSTSFDTLGQSLSYTFTVTNTGDTTIIDAQPITIDDPKIAAVDCSAQPATLAPGDSFQCTGTYTGVTQAEIDAGEVVNSATASFDAPGGTVTSAVATATVPSTIVPELSLTKTGPASFGAVGSTVTYTFAVTNETAQTIATASVTDPLIPGLSCSFVDIGPNATVTCTGDYTVTQADLDAGQIANTATASGTATTGELLSDTASETVTADPAAQVRALSLDKSADLPSFAAVGDEIDYTFAVTNTGTMTLTGITVADAAVGLNCTIPSLAPGATNASLCRATHVVSQADIDAGFFFNEATAQAPGTPASTDSVTTPGPTRVADFTVAKTASDTTDVQAGQVITYSHLVTNTGNTTLTNITLTDSHTSSAGTSNLTFSPSNVIASLAPGSSVTLTTSYTVTQDDIDAGADLTNTVSATATPPTGVASPTATDNETVDVQDQAPALVVDKVESDGSGSFDNLPSSETFTFSVQNTGNVTLSGVVLTDPLTGFSCPLADLAVGATAVTCLDGSPLSTTYTITQADIDAGRLRNEVTVTNGTVSAADAVVLNGPAQLPAISMVKTATAGADFAAVGDEITYEYVITNDGNITLTGEFAVSDDKTSVACPSTPAAGVAPGGQLTCLATYAVTQADLDAGSVTNVATAEISQSVIPGGPQTITSAPATETVSADQTPELTISKVITPGTPTTFADPTDTISYDFTLINSGNVTIPAPITVDDDQIGTGLTCAVSDLAPGAQTTCTHVWTATQPAIDAGSITNVAAPVATFGGSPVPGNTDTVTALAVQDPDLTILKEFVSLSNNSFAAGETITYRFTVTNSGNTTVATEPSITDSLITNPAAISIDAPFPAGGLLPGDSITYTGTYILSLDDVRLGSVTNNATATSGGVTSPPSTVTTPEGAEPALTVTKAADVTAFDTLGQAIVYTYTVTNSSTGVPEPALANPITITDDKFPGSAIACDPTADGQLLVGETTTCTATYFVTQADLDAGEVVNAAFAETTFGTTNVSSPPQSVTVPGGETPSLALLKETLGAGDPVSVGDTVSYRLTATNDGNQTLGNVSIDDPLLPGLSCTVGGVPAAGIVTLAPSEALICEGSYTATQDDIDAQTIDNTATASATNPKGVNVTDTATVSYPVEPIAPEITVEKTLAVGEPGSAYSAVGEELTFQIEVTNTGNVTLTETTVTDSIVPGTCSVGPLAPGASSSICTFVYTVTQADIDRGFIDNTATATSTPATPGAADITGSDSLRSVGPAAAPEFGLAKIADISTFDAVGTTITYTFNVANLGNVTLTEDPVIADDKIASVSCPALPVGGLAPNEFIVCTATYQTTQADLDNGEVTNIASVSSAEVPFDPLNPGGAQATETVDALQTPGLAMVKTPDVTEDVGAGDTITYSYQITNTGNVTLTNVTLADDHTSTSGTQALSIQPSDTVTSIAPGQSVTLTAAYVVTQADVDAGEALTNLATVTAASPDGSNPSVSDDASVTPEDSAPALEVLKTVSRFDGTALGDVVTFQITVENTGNVTLTDIALADTLRRQDGSLITPAPTPVLTDGDAGTLSPAEVWTYEVSHTLTQADVDSGGLSNSALATGTAPDETDVADRSDTGTGTGSTATPFAIPSMPALETGKTVAIAGTELGDTVTFQITLTNTGNVTLTSVAVASDTLTRIDGTPLTLASGPTFAGSDAGSAQGTLQVGETATYTATYVLVQEDIDAGGIQNTATGTATPPVGSSVTDVVDTPAENLISAAPAITFTKSLAAGGPTFDAVGDVLTYDFVVTNTGNVTLTDPIAISDPLIEGAGGAVTCPAPPLAPGASVTCSGSYTVTQADLDAGEVVNTATASTPGTTPVTDEETVPALQTPSMEVLKEAETIASADFVVGREVTYTYTVTNTGNITLTDPITVDDNLIADVTCPALPAGGLAPGSDLVCAASYIITAADVSLGSVTNLASASDGTTNSPITSETIPADGTPALTLVKEIDSVTDAGGTDRPGGAFQAVGDLLTYTFTVTNSGTVSFAEPVTVNDARFPDPVSCYTPDGANPDLTAGETISCQATYAVTQEDLDAGEVFNEAFAESTTAGNPVTSPPSSVTTPAATTPAIVVEKSVDSATFAAVGDVLTYSFTVTNTGNQTLDAVAVSDPLLPGLICTVPSLAPGDDLLCTQTLTITQDIMDAGAVTNVASVEAITPDGGGVGDDSDPVTSTAPAIPSDLSLVKTATPTPFGGVGSVITYGFAVTNDGPFTLQDVTVTDPLVPGYACTIATLNVGETNTASCAMPYTVTQDDVDAGEITNTASATGDTPFGRTSTAEDTITTPGPEQVPALEAIKTASVPATTLGSTITYTLTVENTGNVTLTAPVLTDEMERIGTRRPTFLTTPFVLVGGDDGDTLLGPDETWTYTATYIITQADINAGGVSNSVLALADGPDGTTVDDRSDDGIGGNGDDNPTLVPIVRTPVLDVVKSVAVAGSAPGDVVTFRIEAANRGNVDILNVADPVDQLTRRDGTDLSASVSTPVRVAPGLGASVLSPGDTWAWEVTYTLTQADVDAGGIENVATVAGEGPTGDPITAISRDDDPSDGNPPNDPTELNIAPSPGIEVVKVLSGDAPSVAGDVVTFAITTTNTGNVSLSPVTLTDTMTNLAGDPLTPDSITPEGPVTLAAGATQVYTVAYTLTQADIDAGGVQNTATASGETPTGGLLSDVSDDGDDGDGNSTDDPTIVPVPADNTMVVLKEATTPSRITGTEFETTFTITVSNEGNVTQENLSVIDDLTVFVAPATLVDVAAPVVSGVDSGGANAGYDGVADTETLAPGTSLLPGSTATIDIAVRYDIAAGSPASPNTVSLVTDRITSPIEDSVTLPTSSPAADILAAKQVTSSGPYRAGSVVDYEITFTNQNSTPEIGMRLIDRLPVGLQYIPDTATYNGAATPAPTVSGRTLEWGPVTLAPGESVTLTLSALLLDGAGSYTNQAFAEDSTGQRISNLAEAQVDVPPEAVFDCSDVIGKVFDDRNANGYQDPPPDRSAQITDQTYYADGKFDTSPEVIDQQQNGEPGLAGVRLVTPRGDIITTDAYGRYSVPCALLPAEIGSNFTLKLDEDSLPTGYRVTSENPRTLRLTSGIMAELNFGAALGNAVDIDLTAAAFGAGSDTPSASLVRGVEGLVAQIAATPSVLRITYYRGSEDRELARARLRAVEALIRDRWTGRYDIRIETTIARVQ